MRLIVVGDPATREALIGLIRAFDVDTLAGQSYALFPVSGGDAQGSADGAAGRVPQPERRRAGQPGARGADAGDQLGAGDRQPALVHRGRQARLLAGRARAPADACAAGTSITCRTAAATTSPTCCSRPSRPGHVTAVPTPTGSFAPGSQTSRLGGGGLGGGGLGGGGLGGGGLGGGGLGGGGLGGGGRLHGRPGSRRRADRWRAAASRTSRAAITRTRPRWQPAIRCWAASAGALDQTDTIDLHGDDAHHPEQPEQRHPDLRHAAGGRRRSRRCCARSTSCRCRC